MTRIRTLIVAVVATLGMSVVAVASATAHEFIAHAKQFPATLTDEGGEQVFTTKAGTVTCEKETSSGVAASEKYLTNTETVHYTGKCTAGGVAKVTEPIVAEYEFGANGTSKVLKTITIKVEKTFFTAECTISVAAGQTLTGISYTNNPDGTLGVTANVQKQIHSTGSGGVCGGTETEGSYTGTSTAKLVETGAILEWV